MNSDNAPAGKQSDWANDTIEDFLEAAIAWAVDSGFGATQGLDGSSLWKSFATFLHSGKVYE